MFSFILLLLGLIGGLLLGVLLPDNVVFTAVVFMVFILALLLVAQITKIVEWAYCS